ncbi:MAG: tetratricopeptide repeat protein [Neglectibacter timonensis]
MQDTARGMDWLRTAAEGGNRWAMYRLGKELLKGQNTKQDAAGAVEWFTRSAEQDSPYAQYLLGKLYLMGKEVPRDEEQAVQWLTRSAEQGNEYARYLLDHREEQRPPDVMLAVTRLLYHISRVFQDNSIPESRPGGIQIDRKRLKKLREKKIAQGHKPDDHEEQQSEMTM